MTEPMGIARKDFLRGRLRPSTGRTTALAQAQSDDPELAMLESDFPAEVLNEEAARLGLDPATTDRPTMLRAVLKKMQDQRGF